MNSGDTGSMQSSSGGDEEYDSRPPPAPETISPFLNNNPPPNSGLHFHSISHPLQQPPIIPLPHHHHHHPSSSSSSLFDPNSFSSQSPANPNLFNLDSVWSRNLRSDHPNNYSDLGPLSLTGLPAPSYQNPFPSPLQANFRQADGEIGRPAVVQSEQQPTSGKNSKKRTRASRRAPTTVLTTDTSNFRQMVQEFTGIPAPPFSSTLPYNRRLDLFGSGSGLGAGAGSFPLIRPSVLKVHHPPPFLSSSSNSSMIQSSISPNTNNPSAINSTITTTSISSTTNTNFNPNNYQSQHPNPVMTFQSLLQSPFPKYPQPNSAAIDEFGMSSAIGGFGSHGSSSDHHQARREEINDDGNDDSNVGRWREGGEGESMMMMRSFNGSNNNNNGTDSSSSQQQQHHVHGGGYKFTAEAVTEKSMENVTSRGTTTTTTEGTVDSWICPSD